MTRFRSLRFVLLIGILLALFNTAAAQINNPINGYMGGDGLFCGTNGCELLNQKGVSLGKWSQADIQAALATCAAEGKNMEIGTVAGTHGSFTLSAVYDGPNAVPVCSLQFNGFEGDGKESKAYQFEPRDDESYEPLGIPVAEPAPVPPPTGGCGYVRGAGGVFARC